MRRTVKLTAGLLAVLLDDDPLVHMNWKMAARAAGAELRAFMTPAEREAAAALHARGFAAYPWLKVAGKEPPWG